MQNTSTLLAPATTINSQLAPEPRSCKTKARNGLVFPSWK